MNNLKRLRKEQGLTVTELARRLSVSQANLTKIENSQISLKPDLAQKIADVLNVSPQTLLPQSAQSHPAGLELINPEVLNLPNHTALPVLTEQTSESLSIYIMPDDTMSPTLSKHDLVIVDTSCLSPKENGVYLIKTENKYELVRLQHIENNQIKVIFDNKNYPNYDISSSQLSVKAKALKTLKVRELN